MFAGQYYFVFLSASIYRFIIGKIIIRVSSKCEDYDQNLRWIKFIYRNLYIYVEQSNILLSHVISWFFDMQFAFKSCICCLDGWIARCRQSTVPERFRRNRRADREAGEGKTSGRSLNTGGGIKRANSWRAPLFLPCSVFLPLFFRPPFSSFTVASLLERVTPSGFPLFTFIWIFLAPPRPLLPLIRREPCANLLHEPSSFLSTLNLRLFPS